MYLSAIMMKPGSRDNCMCFWRDLESHIGRLYIEQVDTSVIDELKSSLPTHLGPESIKAIQAQLGHKSAKSTHQYAHLGQRAQLRLVAALEPAAPPHVNVWSTSERR